MALVLSTWFIRQYQTPMLERDCIRESRSMKLPLT